MAPLTCDRKATRDRVTPMRASKEPYDPMIDDIAVLGLVWALLAAGAGAFTLLVLILTRD